MRKRIQNLSGVVNYPCQPNHWNNSPLELFWANYSDLSWGHPKFRFRNYIILPKEWSFRKGHLFDGLLPAGLYFTHILFLWKSLASMFHRLVYEFHPFLEYGLIIIQKELYHFIKLRYARIDSLYTVQRGSMVGACKGNRSGWVVSWFPEEIRISCINGLGFRPSALDLTTEASFASPHRLGFVARWLTWIHFESVVCEHTTGRRLHRKAISTCTPCNGTATGCASSDFTADASNL